MSYLIYLASPYKHDDAAIKTERWAKACAARDYLLRDGWNVFSPIAHNHNSLDLPDDWDFWSKFDFSILSRCDALYVLMLDGWQQSVGVQS